MQLSIIVPCFNEEANIAAVAQDAITVARGATTAFEFIAVDDGSNDDTPQILSALEATLPEFRVVRHATNRGYGAALRTGFAQARFDYLFYTDGDGQFDMAELPHALTLLREHDFVAGYRRARQDGAWRALCGRMWTSAVNVLLGLQVRDVNCAFKAFPARFLLDADLRSSGATIGAELLSEARKHGLSIAELGVRHRSRRSGEQSGASPSVVCRALIELAALSRRRGHDRTASLRTAFRQQP